MPRTSKRINAQPASGCPSTPVKKKSRSGLAASVNSVSPATGKKSAPKKIAPKKVVGLNGIAAPPVAKAAAKQAVGTIDSGFLNLHPKVGLEAVLEHDVRLALVNRSNNTDKYYNCQLLTTKSKVYCWTRWGRTGTSGSAKVTTGTLEAMTSLFEKQFKAKTGVSYEDAMSGALSPIPGKYEWLSVVRAAVSGQGIESIWEYYVSDGIDGKATGWYPYDAGAAATVEELYTDFVVCKNATMGVRFVSSGNWTYRVDLTSSAGAYSQTNTSTGKSRKIRRRIDDDGDDNDKMEEEEEEEVDDDDDDDDDDEQGLDIPLDAVLARHLPGNQYKVLAPFGVILNQTDISESGNKNKAYHIQIAHIPGQSESFVCFTRWNRVGEEGKSATTSPGPLEEAEKEFRSKFKAKSGNDWDSRNNFVKKKNKYELLKMDYSSKVSKPTGKVQTKCSLDAPVAELVDFVFSEDMFKSNLEELGLDVDRMPLGSLSQQQVSKAYEVLVDIEKEIKKKKPSKAKLAELSSLFFTRFPHSFGRQRAPVINSAAMLQEKYDLVAVVSDIEAAQQMTNTAASEEEHPLDAKYKTLKADISLVNEKKEEDMIKQYLAKTQGSQDSFKLLNCFKVARHGEEKRFAKHEKDDNRKLLWHGTSPAVVAAILKNGLRIMPHSGGRVGRGIYLASEHAKSRGYTGAAPYKQKCRAIMFLVEASLGNEKVIFQDDSSLRAPPKGFNSVVARGLQSPFGLKDTTIDLDGKEVIVPGGKPVPTKVSSTFQQDEYLIYDESQHRLRYVVQFEY